MPNNKHQTIMTISANNRCIYVSTDVSNDVTTDVSKDPKLEYVPNQKVQIIIVRPPIVEILFIVVFYCLCECAVHSGYWLFYFYLLYLAEEWGCKQGY